MICEEHTWQVTCDTDLKRLRLTAARHCTGAGPRLRNHDEALKIASDEGLVPHRDGKHHLCRPCAELNPQAVAAS